MRKKGTKPCPTNKELCQAFEDTDPRRKEEIIAHASECPECRMKFDILKKLEEELDRQVGRFLAENPTLSHPDMFRKTARQSLSAWRGEKRRAFLRSAAALRVPLWVFLSAFALTAVVVSFFSIRLSETAAVRGAGEDALNLIAPLGEVPSPPIAFRWRPVPRAQVYHFKIIGSNLATLFSGEVRDEPEIFLPEEVRVRLEKGTTYLWTVEAEDDEGKLLASRTGSFFIP